MLKAIAEAGVRHLGVEPSGGVAEMAHAKGIRVRKSFFEEETARDILAADGRADVIYAANTLCHIPYMESILRGVTALLAPTGVFVFEDPYFSEIVERTSFDQIYDEHFYFFTVRAVQAMAARFDLELVDVERLPVHGGEVRYTLAHAGARTPAPAVAELLADENKRNLAAMPTLKGFARSVEMVRDDLMALLRDLRDDGKTVVGYGATAKSATVTNYCGIGPDLVPFICDTTSPSRAGSPRDRTSRSGSPPRSPTPTPTTRCCSPGTTPRRSWPRSAPSARRAASGSCTCPRCTSSDPVGPGGRLRSRPFATRGVGW